MGCRWLKLKRSPLLLVRRFILAACDELSTPRINAEALFPLSLYYERAVPRSAEVLESFIVVSSCVQRNGFVAWAGTRLWLEAVPLAPAESAPVLTSQHRERARSYSSEELAERPPLRAGKCTSVSGRVSDLFFFFPSC